MQISERGLADLIADEGEVLRAYRDVAGIWTIGVGLTAASGVIKPVAGMTITREQSRALLRDALQRSYAPAVTRRLGAVPQHVFDAALSFHFNTGAIARASWVAKYLKGDLAGAEAAFIAWSRAGGRVVEGLVKRRAREWKLLTSGQYAQRASMRPDAALRRVLQQQDSGTAVKALQDDLIALGYLASGHSDGEFGGKTDAAVRALQRAHPDLTVDGRVGPATAATIRRLRIARQHLGATAAATIAAGAVAAGWDWRWALFALALIGLGSGLAAFHYRSELRLLWRRARAKGA